MGEQLSPLDATFLELEQLDEGGTMHIGAVMVFDSPTGSGAPPVELLIAEMAPRIDPVPRFRQRLSTTHIGGLHWPTWEPVEGFDVSAHVRHAMLPAPGGDEELFEWAGDFFSHRLDRTRPLWEMVIVDGLAEGRWAAATKLHHSLVDGVGSLDIGQMLLDTEPHKPRPMATARRARARAQRSAAEADAAPAMADSSGRPWWAPPGLLLRGARAGVDLALHPQRVPGIVDHAAKLAELLARNELVAAPPTSINHPIGPTRRFRAVRLRLEEINAVRHTLGGTVNDIALAVAAGGLRRMLLDRGDDLPDAPGLRAMVPVNVRVAEEEHKLGNRVSTLFVHLPVDEADARARLERIVAESRKLKEGHKVIGATTLIDLSGLAPPALHVYLAGQLYAPRLFNLTITNVPGPRTRLYALDCPMRELLPLVPLAADRAIGIAMFSYDGTMCFGLAADHDSVPDLLVLAEGMEESFAELLALAGAAVA